MALAQKPQQAIPQIPAFHQNEESDDEDGGGFYEKVNGGSAK
jgi:hypothetical protein